MGKTRSFAVIGLGRLGSRVARELAAYGNHVIGIDVDEKLVSAVADELTEAVVADARDEAALRETGIGSCDSAVVAIGSSLEASVLCHMNLSNLGVEQITVKAFDERHARILSALGAEDILIPEQEAGERVAQRLHNQLILDYMKVYEGNYVALTSAPTQCVGKAVGELDLMKRHEVRCIGIMRSDKYLSPDDPADLFVGAADQLLIQGSRAAIRDFADAG